MILLDTNVVSAVMAIQPDSAVLAWMRRRSPRDLFLSSITIAEIRYGLRILPMGRKRRELENRFERFLRLGFEQRILGFDEHAAHEYAEIMGHRKEIGRPMSTFDGQIAAIARLHGMRVATRNVSDFVECGIEILDPFLDERRRT